MNVFFTRDLHAAVGADAPALKRHFTEWQGLADPCTHFEFGRTTPEKMPVWRDFDVLWHTHLTPAFNTPKYGDWLTKWNFSDPRFTRAKCNRLSDRLLFYAEHRGDWLLLTIANHSVFGSKWHQEKWADVADRWVALRSK